MQYAIELYYDQETEHQLFRLAQRVSEEKLSTKFLEWKTRPHLTLACFNDIDEEKCIRLLKEFAQTHNRMPAYIASVGMFSDTKTIFVSPIMTAGMYQLQRELHEFLSGFDTKGWEWYRPDRWVPHCTIALTRDDPEDIFYRASELILHEFKKTRRPIHFHRAGQNHLPGAGNLHRRIEPINRQIKRGRVHSLHSASF